METATEVILSSTFILLAADAGVAQVERARPGAASDPRCYGELVEAGRRAIARAFAEDGVCDDLLSLVSVGERSGAWRLTGQPPWQAHDP